MIIEEMFWGNIYPSETVDAPREEIFETEQEIYKITKYFEETMLKKEFLMLEDLIDHYAHRELMSNKAHFIYGFRLGAQMIQEIFL